MGKKKGKVKRLTCGGCRKQFEDKDGDRGYCEDCERAKYMGYFYHRTVDTAGYAYVLLIFAFTACFGGLAYAEGEPDFERLVEAIYLAEGAKKAVKPFGILSVPCDGYEDCRQVALNTVRNNWKRWQAKTHGADKHPDYLSFLASRYAPIGASNDPMGLNNNWLKNIRGLYGKV